MNKHITENIRKAEYSADLTQAGIKRFMNMGHASHEKLIGITEKAPVCNNTEALKNDPDIQ